MGLDKNMNSLERRLAKLTSIYVESRSSMEQRLREEIAQMSRAERHLKMRSLVLKLMRVRGIKQMGSENLADTAVRAVATTRMKAPGWEHTIRDAFQEEVLASQL